jgi:hypothetical protein
MNNCDNRIEICGEITSEYEFSHKAYGEKFYKTEVVVQRNSGRFDSIPVIVPSIFIGSNLDRQGDTVRIYGELRNPTEFQRRREKIGAIYLFAKEFDYVNSNSELNSASLTGRIVRTGRMRETWSRGIVTDFTLAVCRGYRKEKIDYIPCIAWGRNAIRLNTYDEKKNLKITGRIQSREYIKILEDKTEETRTTYEVSISSFNEIMAESEVS